MDLATALSTELGTETVPSRSASRLTPLSFNASTYHRPTRFSTTHSAVRLLPCFARPSGSTISLAPISFFRCFATSPGNPALASSRESCLGFALCRAVVSTSAFSVCGSAVRRAPGAGASGVSGAAALSVPSVGDGRVRVSAMVSSRAVPDSEVDAGSPGSSTRSEGPAPAVSEKTDFASSACSPRALAASSRAASVLAMPVCSWKYAATLRLIRVVALDLPSRSSSTSLIRREDNGLRSSTSPARSSRARFTSPPS